jgi:hypothetical protein
VLVAYGWLAGLLAIHSLAGWPMAGGSRLKAGN